MYTILMSEEPQIERLETQDEWLVIYRDLLVCQANNVENWCDLKENFKLENGDYFLTFDTKP